MNISEEHGDNCACSICVTIIIIEAAKSFDRENPLSIILSVASMISIANTFSKIQHMRLCEISFDTAKGEIDNG